MWWFKFNKNLMRYNDSHKLIGNGDHLKRFINPYSSYNIEDTLRWMLKCI